MEQSLLRNLLHEKEPHLQACRKSWEVVLNEGYFSMLDNVRKQWAQADEVSISRGPSALINVACEKMAFSVSITRC
jgi:hypothetical protein